jgi:hypothetical protein
LNGRIVDGSFCTSCAIDNVEVCEEEFWDDVSGEPLDPDLVRKARAEEMDEIRKHGVYKKVKRGIAWEATGKAPIKVRWVDVNKGDKTHPEYRSRLVAKESKLDKRNDLFAATPPLEAKKLLFSWAVTEGIGYFRGMKDRGMKLDFIDVRRAYFHADARRKVFVELPDEDWEEGMCGKLEKSMYGTRDASQNWEEEYSSHTSTFPVFRTFLLPSLHPAVPQKLSFLHPHGSTLFEHQ